MKEIKVAFSPKQMTAMLEDGRQLPVIKASKDNILVRGNADRWFKREEGNEYVATIR